MNVLEEIDGQLPENDLSNIQIGAEVKLNYWIREGEKKRIQAFQGVVIARHGTGKQLGSTITIRKVTQGCGVERVFPIYSPNIESVQFIRQGRVRRAKLYFLRNLKGKKARLREKRRS